MAGASSAVSTFSDGKEIGSRGGGVSLTGAPSPGRVGGSSREAIEGSVSEISSFGGATGSGLAFSFEEEASNDSTRFKIAVLPT
jgi:hypothetical protein